MANPFLSSDICSKRPFFMLTSVGAVSNPHAVSVIKYESLVSYLKHIVKLSLRMIGINMG